MLRSFFEGGERNEGLWGGWTVGCVADYAAQKFQNAEAMYDSHHQTELIE